MSSASAGCGWNRGSNHEELHLDDREDGDNHQMSPDERKSTTSTTSDATTAFLLFDEEDGLVSKCSPTCDDLLQLRASLLDPQYAHPRDYPLWAKIAGLSWGESRAWTVWCLVYSAGVLGMAIYITQKVVMDKHASVFGVFTVITPNPPEILGAMQLVSVLLSGASHISIPLFAARHIWAPPCAAHADPRRTVDRCVYGFCLVCFLLLIVGNLVNPGDYSWEVNFFVWAACGTLFSWMPAVTLIAMLLVDVERHTHHIAIFAAALRLRASVVSPARGREKDRSNSNNSVDAVSCDAGPAAATAARRSSLTRLRSLDSTKSRVELLLLPDGAGDDDAPAAPLTCVEASTLYMALHAHARHISATFSVVMSLQLANMLLSTTVSAYHLYRGAHNQQERGDSFVLAICIVILSVPVLFAPLVCVAACNTTGERLKALLVRCSPVEKAHSAFDMMPIVQRAAVCPVTITLGGVTVNPLQISGLSLLYLGYYVMSAYSRATDV